MFNSVFDIKYVFDDSQKEQITKIKNSIYCGEVQRDMLKDEDVVKCKINIVYVSETKINVRINLKSKNIALCDFTEKYLNKEDIEGLKIKYFDCVFESDKNSQKLCTIRQHYDITQKDIDLHVSLTELGKSYFEKQ